MELVLMGAGEKLEFLLRALPMASKSYRLIEIWDNDLARQGKQVSFQGIEFSVAAPRHVPKEVLVIITADRYESEMRQQLIEEIHLSGSQVHNWRYLFDDLRQEIIRRYENSLYPDMMAAVKYLRHHELNVFLDGLYEKYCGQEDAIKVFKDETCGLYYVLWNERKLYMKRNASLSWIQGYVNDLYREQDRKSPHSYAPFVAAGLEGDVLVDAGAAEGFFALDVIDQVRKVYLIERDPEWVEALRYTFAPYIDKVVLIDKCLGNHLDDTYVTLDSLDTKEAPISYIKMDIEGDEESAFEGAKQLLADNRTLRILACTYHRPQDADILGKLLLQAQFSVKFSSGYMFFPYGEELLPELRHGLIYGEKKERQRIAVWGVGTAFEDVFAAIRQDACEIAAIVDLRWERFPYTKGMKVVSPEFLQDSSIDYVILTPKDSGPLLEQGHGLHLPGNKMLSFWQDDLGEYPFIRTEVWQKAVAIEEKKRLARRLYNAPYEYGVADFPEIRSGEAGLQEVIQQGKSLCRFGDGEFEMMRLRERPWFQEPKAALAQRLQQIIRQKIPNLCVCVADNFGNLEKYTEEAADDIRSYVAEGETRQAIRAFLREDMIYYDAYVSRPYIIYRDKAPAAALFKLWKKVWEGRRILLAEGYSSRMGRGSDLFDNAKDVRRILCPEQNAFDVYEEILTQIKQSACDNDLVLLSLGPTATVLAYDLAVAGIQAVDIGQLDNEYDWYRMGVRTRQLIEGKTVAELFAGHHPQSVEDPGYEQEIVARVGVS